MYVGSQRAKLTRKDTVFVVGESRVGKSTFFNHLLGIRLKGVSSAKNKRNIIYEADMFDQAKACDSFKSVTILPNIRDV